MKGVVAKLVHLRDPTTTTALEVAAGGKLYQVIIPPRLSTTFLSSCVVAASSVAVPQQAQATILVKVPNQKGMYTTLQEGATVFMCCMYACHNCIYTVA